jgi:ribonucleoside-diphosphate reductase alpha chain/ribonucleoside-triphosphate reductase
MSSNIDTFFYYVMVRSNVLSWEFYEPYTKKEPPFGQLGLMVQLRTYSRYIPYDWVNTFYKEGDNYEDLLKQVPDGLKRREKWCEVVLRVTNYLCNLHPSCTNSKIAEKIFDAIYNLRVFPSGRCLWVAGTKAVKRNPTALFNCSFSVIDSISSIAEGFYLLLVGAGFGFSLEERYTVHLPLFNKKIQIDHNEEETSSELNYLSKNSTYFSVSFKNEKYNYFENVDNFYVYTDKACKEVFNRELDNPVPNLKSAYTIHIVVGDSKEGWVNALKVLLIAYTKVEVHNIVVYYGNIRKAGERLKTFGGRSSGASALIDFFKYIEEVITEGRRNLNFLEKLYRDFITPDSQFVELTTLQLLDIINAMGKSVVVGGVRRSSEIALGDINDEVFRDAKKDIWTKDPAKAAIRAMSNNSIVLRERPSLQWFLDIMNTIRTNGEPGFYCLDTANEKFKNNFPLKTEYNPTFYEIKGTNPCGEILLDNKGVCNLSEVNVKAHINSSSIDEDYSVNYCLLKESLQIATLIGALMTTVELFHPEWDSMQKKSRLLGVSLTGIVEAVNLLEPNHLFALNKEYIELFSFCRNIVNKSVLKITDVLKINTPLRTTTIKPSGTLSQLPTVSSGIHDPYAPYYIRRVTVSTDDPLCKCLQDMGVPWEAKIGEEKASVLFSFPIKTEAERRSIDVSAIEQLERYRLSMEHYVEHNTSCTITVADTEWETVANWLYDNYGSWIGISFLPRFDPSESKMLFPQMPYETCTKEQYDEMVKIMPKLTENELLTILSKYENDYKDYSLDTDCVGGACPVK